MSLDRLVSPAARNQLVLEVGDAGEEPNPFQLAAIKVWTVAHPLQRRSDDFLFALVIKPGKLGSRFLGSQLPQEPADRVGAVDRNDGHAFGLEVPSDRRAASVKASSSVTPSTKTIVRIAEYCPRQCWMARIRVSAVLRSE